MRATPPTGTGAPRNRSAASRSRMSGRRSYAPSLLLEARGKGKREKGKGKREKGEGKNAEDGSLGRHLRLHPSLFAFCLFPFPFSLLPSPLTRDSHPPADAICS